MARSSESGAGVAPAIKIVLIAIGLLLISYLVVTDRHGWFRLRPASGSAAAMAAASDKPAP
jgi:hypothetical protein